VIPPSFAFTPSRPQFQSNDQGPTPPCVKPTIRANRAVASLLWLPNSLREPTSGRTLARRFRASRSASAELQRGRHVKAARGSAKERWADAMAISRSARVLVPLC
jgi:hypothetical protein